MCVYVSTMTDFSPLQDNIHITFRNVQLLQNAFVHRSYLNEHRDFALPSNEKLEFLGDSVLSLVTSVYLYRNYPHFAEGDYTEIKAAIVKTSSLAQAAAAIDLGSYLLLSKGEEHGKGRSNVNLLADSFEALIGVIFLDQGFETAYEFIAQHLFKDVLDEAIRTKSYYSSKTRLQELVQAQHKKTPKYTLTRQDGPEHDRVFTVSVSINGQEVATGVGKSKKEAEEMAADHALKSM